MITRALFLSVAWLVLSFLGVIIGGVRLRRGGLLRTMAWLFFVVALADLWAYLTFGVPREILLLSGVAFALGMLAYYALPDWNAFGQVGLMITLLATVIFLAYTFLVVAFTPLSVVSYLLAMGFFFVEAVALILALSHAYESFDVVTRVRWRRRPERIQTVENYYPRVSFHVPAYNEPPELLAQTLDHLANLDYPNFEVLVVDNNTPETETWQAVKEMCDRLGPDFHFLHLDHWPGFKSGALNFALTQTDPDAEIIAVLDADYHVDPEFLRDTVGAFVDPQVAFLQTPQDYRDFAGNRFGETIYDSYRYFFQVSMPARNEDNAIIFCGTMGLIRKSVLQEIGGWDEWCITEDAEASLRILKRGYTSLYYNRTYGKGLLPLEFEGMKKQRFRWCFGGIQILRKHWEALMPWAHLVDPANRLTGAQRYFYLVGGLQWYTDLLNLVFVFYLVLGGLYGLVFQRSLIQPLTGPLIIIPAVYLVLNLWRFVWLLHSALRLPWRRSLGSMYSFFAMGWAVALADLQGLRRAEGVFLRTPKSGSTSKVVHALRVSWWEGVIGGLCAATGIALLVLQAPHQPQTLFLAGLLGWQSSLYLSAPALSLLSAFGGRPMVQPVARPMREPGRPAVENNLGRIALATAALLALLIGFAQLLPRPARPLYSAYRPPEIAPQNLVPGAATPTPTPPLTTPTPRPTASPAATRMPRTTPTQPAAAPTPVPLAPTAAPPLIPVLPLPTISLPSLPPILPTAAPPPAQPVTSTAPSAPTPVAPALPPLIPPINLPVLPGLPPAATPTPVPAPGAQPPSTGAQPPSQAPSVPSQPPAGPSVGPIQLPGIPSINLPIQLPSLPNQPTVTLPGWPGVSLPAIPPITLPTNPPITLPGIPSITIPASGPIRLPFGPAPAPTPAPGG
jgi:cellulose synthase/poly-beta-1,6-N-acetylglucosamine synthase-like glycosyltransferase